MKVLARYPYPVEAGLAPFLGSLRIKIEKKSSNYLSLDVQYAYQESKTEIRDNAR
jgi:hypothetical protein